MGKRWVKKFSAFRMGSNLSVHQLNIDGYIYKMLYIQIKVNTNQKPVIWKRIIGKWSKHSTKESQQTMREESKRRKEQRKTTKQP